MLGQQPTLPMTTLSDLPPARLSWTIWGLGALFYMTGFYHRVAPAVMTDQLMADFQIGAKALGHFSAFYFYSYVAMQVPTGILASSVMVTGFAFGRESVPRAFDGTVNGVINMGVMIGPMVLQPAIGWWLERGWNGQLENGVPVYSADAFRSAFGLMLAASVAAALLLIPAKETGCRQAVP